MAVEYDHIGSKLTAKSFHSDQWWLSETRAPDNRRVKCPPHALLSSFEYCTSTDKPAAQQLRGNELSAARAAIVARLLQYHPENGPEPAHGASGCASWQHGGEWSVSWEKQLNTTIVQLHLYSSAAPCTSTPTGRQVVFLVLLRALRDEHCVSRGRTCAGLAMDLPWDCRLALPWLL